MDWKKDDAARRRRMRDRKAAVAVVLAILVVLPAIYLAPLVSQRAEGPSAEAAIADADKKERGDFTYALEREYADGEGRTVYRLVSDSQPAVVKELRYGFRWLPEVSVSPSVVPSIHVSDPGPYYELVNEDEWRRSVVLWNREQMRREADSGGSLRDAPRQGGADG